MVSYLPKITYKKDLFVIQIYKIELFYFLKVIISSQTNAAHIYVFNVTLHIYHFLFKIKESQYDYRKRGVVFF